MPAGRLTRASRVLCVATAFVLRTRAVVWTVTTVRTLRCQTLGCMMQVPPVEAVLAGAARLRREAVARGGHGRLRSVRLRGDAQGAASTGNSVANSARDVASRSLQVSQMPRAQRTALT